MVGIVEFLLFPIAFCVRTIERLLFMLVGWYDVYMYSPLQTALWPLVEKVPRCVTVNGQTYDVFTANIVSWSRTLLVIPIAFTLKYKLYWTGFWCVIFHDLLDHLDGIVAKVQKHKYGELDDPIVGGFMDAFCDKIVNVLSLWSIMMVTDFTTLTWTETIIYSVACSIIIMYEFALGVVRVQDFFRAFYFRKLQDCPQTSTAAVMEGKLKEKLESMGIAALCVAQSNPVVLPSFSGILGVSCLCLSLRLAHSSLMSKFNARQPQTRNQGHVFHDEDEKKVMIKYEERKGKEMKTTGIQTRKSYSVKKDETSDCDENVPHGQQQEKAPVEKHRRIPRCFSLNDTSSVDTRADRVYTVGCFDLFHHGHVRLLNQMRTFGKKVIVGVHDSRSIYQLKKQVPVDSTVTRMRNVKQYSDEVFCVAGTDPTPFIDYIFDKSNNKVSTIYLRGDDMPQFPARHLCEQLMTVKFLPYTEGVSSTKLRKDLFNMHSYDLMLNDGLGEILPY